MSSLFAVPAPERGLLRLSGPDVRSFLQGIVSNDVEKASPQRAIWSAFLTPQGKYLHDFFIVEHEDGLLLEMAAERRADLARRLRPYKLRAKVEIEPDFPALQVVLGWGEGAAEAVGLSPEAGAAAPFSGGIAYVDPRLPEAGVRFLLPAATAEASLREAGFEIGEREHHEALRIKLGLPDGARDMEVEKAILLENGFDELGGVDWQKGCYLGQELTARTKYRGLVKKRLLPVRFEGTLEPGMEITRNGRVVGDIRSAADGQALALLRLDALEGPLEADGKPVTPARPAWVRLQAEEKA